MKKWISISLFIFWVVIVSVLTAGLVLAGKNQNKKEKPIQSVLSQSENKSGNDKETVELELSTKEVVKHNTSRDCWMIISNKVYDFTSYLSQHPGGASTILPYCGKDGTQAFVGKPHSSYASSLLPRYYIGDLYQKIKISAVKKNELSLAPSQRPPSYTSTPPTSAPAPTNPSGTSPGGTNPGSGVSAAEVAKHSFSSDCWMIISNKVYDLTSYIPSHPGGSAIVSYCGKDGTSAFSGHSSYAVGLLSSYFIGNLSQDNSTTTTSTVTNIPTAPNLPTSVPRRHSDDDD